MAVHIKLDCPHTDCLAEGAGFSGTHYHQFRPGFHEYIMLLQCGVCGNGVVAKYAGVNFTTWVSGHGRGDTRLLETWPKRPPTEGPQYLPDNVSRYFFQGMDSLRRRNFDAAGTMFRKALDTGLKRLDPAGRGTLERRINSLPTEIGITPPMKEWAHQIRHLGNDAAHEDDPFTEDEAKSLQSFTELFLTYAFTLPGMLAARQPPAEGRGGQ